MISADEARALILSKAALLESERVPLADALHRVLREDILADQDSPRFDCSAMDGYALRTTDAENLLSIVAAIPAGHADEVTIGENECARIFTGGRIPRGADRVAMQEDVEEKNGGVRIVAQRKELNIRVQGENCRRGDRLIENSQRLRAIELAIMASCGVTQPLVTRRARVAHFATGNELVDAGETPTGSQIRDCNSTLIRALLREHGAELVRQERIGDSLDVSQAALHQLREEIDILLISGGAGGGDHDFTRSMLTASGFTIHLEKINLRPGKPLIFASRGTQLAFGLPGNPVSHWAIFQLFLAPLFAAMSGCEIPRVRTMRGRLRQDFVSRASERETCWPATAEFDAGEWHLRLLRFISSGDVAGLAGANALVRIAPKVERIAESETVEFLWCQS